MSKNTHKSVDRHFVAQARGSRSKLGRGRPCNWQIDRVIAILARHRAEQETSILCRQVCFPYAKPRPSYERRYLPWLVNRPFILMVLLNTVCVRRALLLE